MSAPKNGGPAFPCETYGLRNGKETTIPTNGMSLRDFFAASILAGLHANPHLNRESSCEDMAVACYNMADAMIAECNKEASK